MSLASMIDHTVLAPTTTASAVANLCEEAVEWGFAAVCVPPYHVRDARTMLAGRAPRVATVIGFPFGYSHYAAKAAEGEQALADGAHELDMVINLAALRANDKAWLESEIESIVKITEGRAVLKLIIESGILSMGRSAPAAICIATTPSIS
jgi:deoxyribose-phosphate aldolase